MPELVRRARELDIVPVDARIDRTTVWRACRRMGLPTRQRPHKREGDTRRWRYAERMQWVLADGKHFRAGAARLRRVALCAERASSSTMSATAWWWAPRSPASFMRHGLADLLFLDKGPGFISKDTLDVVQGGLGVLLIHGATRYPEGHGAIERFNRTAYDQALRSLDGAADVGTPLARHSRSACATSWSATTTLHTRPWAPIPPRVSAGSKDAICASPPTTPIGTAASWCAPCTRSPTITSSRPTDGCGQRRVAALPVGSRWRATCSTVGCGFSTRGA